MYVCVSLSHTLSLSHRHRQYQICSYFIAYLNCYFLLLLLLLLLLLNPFFPNLLRNPSQPGTSFRSARLPRTNLGLPSPFALINRFSTHSEVAFRISPPLPAIINPSPARCYWRSLRHLRDLRDGTRMPFSSVLFHPPCSTLSGHILAFCVGGVVVLLASASPL
ncbi:hypothetical protein LZ32DRAFT_442993 [Colletotrichum eremochloae]|nr:hypothetical protein LZ32DRAFT_442993 [Colletotrichum eremochloae]